MSGSAVRRLRTHALRAVALAVVALGWSAGCDHSGENAPPACGELVAEWSGGTLPGFTPLTVPEIQTILGQAVEQSLALSRAAVVAVVDREGFVLGVFAMTGAALGPVFPVPATSPPDAAPGINEAIAKARTAAFLSSNQNAFSSTTAAFIVADHFPPGVAFTPGGPLFGVQNSNDTGSDVLRGVGPGGAPISNIPTPLPDPNGFTGKAGGFPLYKDRMLVGGVGVSSADPTADEKSAVAACRGFMAPVGIQACSVFIDGFRLAFADTDAPFVAPVLAFGALPGSVVDAVTQGPGTLTAGAPAPAIPPATFGGVTGPLLYPVIDSPLAAAPKLLVADVQAIFTQAMLAMVPLRAGIRLPLGTSAQVTVVVVDTAGNVLGAFRPGDNTRFSFDVAAQKARTGVVYSDLTVTAALGEPISGIPLGTAMTSRAIGFLAQPFYPPGIDGTSPGPLFGIQDALPGGTGAGIPGLDVTPGAIGDATDGNGITIFPGGIPLYKAGVLVGGIGVSGDGVDQDDYVAAAGAAGYEPPDAIRCDHLDVRGARLPYVKFPRNPTQGVR
ncbi:MAG TPA: heme-binding protein [Planctomycetota bacterium]|nr:heme-binding protein [Planctomycetota bacterium]